MKIFVARDEDAHQGWVWLQDAAIPQRSVVQITNPKNGMSVYCEALQIDGNFQKKYNNPPRISITDPSSTIVIGEWYRASLGGIETQSDVALEIKPCNSWFGRFCSCIHHPQVVVRQAAWLGGIGLLLGILSLALGVISLW